MVRWIVNILFVVVLILLYVYSVESLLIWGVFIAVWFGADYLAAGKKSE